MMNLGLLFLIVSLLGQTFCAMPPDDTNNLDLDCPFECTCADTNNGTGYDVTCRGLQFFPSNIPLRATKITFINALFDVVPINAFLDYPHLDALRFVSVVITTIRACSFAELENMASITFEKCDIDIIQGNAFSNLVNISKIQFIDSTIKHIYSYAFHNLKSIQELEFTRDTIDMIHPIGLQDLSDIGMISIRATNITKFLRGGFSKFTDVGLFVSGNGTKIVELQCSTLDTVLASSGSLQVSNTYLSCDCGLAWVWTKGFERLVSDQSVLCIGRNTTVTSQSIDQICPDVTSRDTGCPPLLHSTPNLCSRTFDDPKEPITMVTYPTFTSHDPGNDVTKPHCQFTWTIALVFLSVLNKL